MIRDPYCKTCGTVWTQCTCEPAQRGSVQRAGSETDEELLSEATHAMKEWWDKCWQTSPCMCAALRPTDFFKFGYLAGRRAHADKSQNNKLTDGGHKAHG